MSYFEKGKDGEFISGFLGHTVYRCNDLLKKQTKK